MKSGFFHILWFSALFFGVWLAVRFLLPLFLPFLLGLALALAAEPMVKLLCRRGVPRGIGTAIGVSMGFCFLGILVLLLGAFLVRQLRLMAGILPDLETTAQSGLSLLQSWLLELAERTPESLRPLLRENVSGLFSDGTALLDQGVRFVLGLAGSVLSHVPDSALTFGTAILSAFLFSAKLPRLKSWTARRLPRQKLEKLLSALRQLRATVGAYLAAQCKLMSVTFGILLIGFVLLRISHAPIWALVTALVDALPVLGTGTVLLPWSAVCFLQGDSPRAIGLLGLYLTISLIRSMLEPKLLGHHLGLDPLVTLIALYAGYKLWGFGGMLLAPMLTVTALQLSAKTGKEQ